MINAHSTYMLKALELAQQALQRDEFPVGCVLVYQGRIIAQGVRSGTRRAVPSEIDHAEMLALRQMETLTDPVDRSQVTLYATLEPCLMCSRSMGLASSDWQGLTSLPPAPVA